MPGILSESLPGEESGLDFVVKLDMIEDGVPKKGDSSLDWKMREHGVLS